MSIPSIRLSNDENMPAMIVGTFQHNRYQTLKDIVSICIENGFTGFDTAPSYGNEESLGKAIHESMHEQSLKRENIYLIDKIDAWQMQKTSGKVTQFVDDALLKLKTEYLDLLLIHWPIPNYFENTWDTLIDLYSRGKTKAIGICNVNERHLIHITKQSGFIPHVVQIERHPLRTDQNTVNFNRENNILTQSYSPLFRMMEPLRSSKIINKIAQKYNKNIGQIIMRWHIDTDSVPVFMTSKEYRIKEYADIFNFRLEAAEIESISSLNCNHKIFLESVGCPGY
ncbi:MAG: aldo/keto reductase family protein [Draconibacterium sp.]